MRKLDLKHTFPRSRPRTEDFENEPRAIDDLRIPRLLEIALLYGCQRMIDDDQADIEVAYALAEFIDLA
jgi:hypothetical protein